MARQFGRNPQNDDSQWLHSTLSLCIKKNPDNVMIDDRRKIENNRTLGKE